MKLRVEGGRYLHYLNHDDGFDYFDQVARVGELSLEPVVFCLGVSPTARSDKTRRWSHCACPLFELSLHDEYWILTVGGLSPEFTVQIFMGWF